MHWIVVQDDTEHENSVKYNLTSATPPYLHMHKYSTCSLYASVQKVIYFFKNGLFLKKLEK